MTSMTPSPKASRPTITQPHHVWPLILVHLRKPIPEALSRAPRIDIRQEDLAAASRVSKHFNEICQPLLYTHIVTDDLFGLLLPQIKPNTEFELHTVLIRKLARTRSLHIEYTDKMARPSYISLCKVGGAGWHCVGLNFEDLRERGRFECEREISAMSHTMKVLTRTSTEATTIFPKLHTITVSSIYGSQRGYDHFYEAKGNPLFGRALTNKGNECLLAFETFTGNLPLRHLCIRDMHGPLNISNSAHHSPRESTEHSPITTTFHLSPQPMYFPLPLGYPVRYTVDASCKGDWANILREMQSPIHVVSNHRRMDKLEGMAFRPANVEIFCSTGISRAGDFAPSIESFGVSTKSTTPQRYTEEDQKVKVAKLSSCLQARLRRDSGLPDKVRWSTSAETPICQACGSGYVA